MEVDEQSEKEEQKEREKVVVSNPRPRVPPRGSGMRKAGSAGVDDAPRDDSSSAGTGMCKVGFLGDDTPRAALRTRKPGSASAGTPRTLVGSGMRTAGSHGGGAPCAAVSADSHTRGVCCHLCRAVGRDGGAPLVKVAPSLTRELGFILKPQLGSSIWLPSSALEAVDLETRL